MKIFYGKRQEKDLLSEINFDATLDDLMGVDGKTNSSKFHKRDIDDLAQDEGKLLFNI